MVTGNSGRTFMYLVLVYASFVSSNPSSQMLIPCEREGFVLTAAYSRSTDRVSVQLRLFQTFALVYLNDSHLTAEYPWIDTNDMLMEEVFAEQQITFLKNLAATFPISAVILITYRVTDDDPLITLHIDDSSTVSYGKSDVSSLGVNGHRMEPYANGTHFAIILGTKGSLLARWRRLCALIKQKDNPNNVTVSFLYDPIASTFKCEFQAYVPMRYYFYLEGGGCKTVWGKLIASDKDKTVTGRVTNSERCKYDEVRCIIMSPHGWERTLIPTIQNFVTEMTTTDRTSDVAKRDTRSRVGIYCTIVFVCMLLILFIVIFVFRRRLGSEPSENIINRIRAHFHYFPMSRERTVTVEIQ